MRHTATATACFVLAMLVGCYTGDAPGLAANGDLGAGGSSVNDAGAGNTALPCEVQAVFASCLGCHGAKPSSGTPMSLVTHADLTAPAKSNPAMTNAQISVLRMQGKPSQMPPTPSTPMTAAQIATVQAWIAGGYATGTCGGADGGVDPYATPPTCTSNTKWTGGDRGAPEMHPGLDCISCHRSGSGTSAGDTDKIMTIAGTVFPSAHEYNDCNGSSGLSSGTKVVIVDAHGTFELPVNDVGNFYALQIDRALAPPYAAKVVSGTKERAMVSHQTTGACNSCHSLSGDNGAPGRIVAP